MTCYLLFYPIHPLLNGLIERMDQRRLFRYSTAMFILYCCLNYLKYDLFFPSALILWITIYFVLAYIKRYMSRFAADFKKNTLIFVAGMTAFLMTAFVINLIGLHVTYMYDKILHWALKECNPFLLIATLGLFNIMRNSSFHSRVINYLAGLSLYIYLIHENILIRTYLRPYMINYIYETYGYEHLLGCVMVVFGVVLGIGVLGSLVYDRTMRKIVASFCDVIYDYLRRKYKAIEDRLMENKDYR